MPSPRSFTEIARLPSSSWGDLVRSGVHVERVYAAWCIASHGTEDERASIRDAVTLEKSPGVRRHLAVILAGRGELDALVALAQHDPDSLVRAGATRLLTQVAADRGELWPLVLERLADVADVRLAVATSLDARTPPEVVRRVASLVDDPNLDVRSVAFDLSALEGAQCAELHTMLARRCVDEADDALRRRCQDRMLRGAPDLVFEQAGTASVARILELVRVANDVGFVIEASSVTAWLARDDDEKVAQVLAGVFAGRDAELSFRTFARLLPHWEWRSCASDLLAALVRRAESVPWSEWPPGARVEVAAICRRIRATLAHLDADPVTRDESDGEDAWNDDRWGVVDEEWRDAARLVLDRFADRLGDAR